MIFQSTNTSTPGINSVEIKIQETTTTSSGASFLGVIVVINEAKLLEENVNLIRLVVDSATPSNASVNSSAAMINTITGGSVSEEYYSDQATEVAIIDVKAGVSSQELVDIAANKPIVSTFAYKKAEFQSLNYGKLNEQPSEKIFRSYLYGVPDLEKSTTFPVMKMNEVLYGSPHSMSTFRAPALNIASPAIRGIETLYSENLSTYTYRVTAPSSQPKIIAELLDENDTVIGIVSSNSDFSSNASGLYAFTSGPSAEFVLHHEIESEATLEIKANRTHAGNVINIYNNSMADKVALYRRSFSSFPKSDKWEKITSFPYRAFAENYAIKYIDLQPTSQTHIYRIVPESGGIPLCLFRQAIIPGDPPMEASPGVIGYQQMDTINLFINNIPSDSKKIIVNRTNLLSKVSKQIHIETIIQETRDRSKTLVDYPGQHGAIYLYDVFIEDRYGRRRPSSDNFVCRFYPIASKSKAKIANFTVESYEDNSGQICHKLQSSVKFENLWIPEKSTFSLNILNDDITTASDNSLRMGKLLVTRHSVLGNSEYVGCFTINPNIHNVTSVEAQGNSVEFVLDLTSEQQTLLGVQPPLAGIQYFYEIRPVSYSVGNELAFMANQPKKEVPAKSGKTPFSFHPYEFENPSVFERGIHRSISNVDKNRLNCDGAHAVAGWAQTLYSFSNSSEFSFSAGYDVIQRVNSITGKKIEIPYVFISFNLPKIYKKSVFQIDLHASVNSVGGFSKIGSFLPIGPSERTYFDFEVPTVACTGIQYIITMKDMNMRKIYESSPVTVNLPS